LDFIDRSPILASLNYAKGQILTRLGRQHRSGTTGHSLGLEKAVAYVREVLDDYVRYGGAGDAARIEGKAILEVGPGDHLGVALMFLAMGAESVTCLEAFQSSSGSDLSSRIYGALYDSMSNAQRQRVADVVGRRADGSMELKLGRLRPYYLSSIEDSHEALTPGRYDIIVSRAVLEHVGDICLGWKNMFQCLKHDGEMWHKIDFRSHQLYERIHPLYFLTIDEPLWRAVSRPDPTLNRARLPVYRNLSSRDFAQTTIYYTRVVEAPELRPHVETLVPGLHYDDKHLDLIRKIRPKLKHPFCTHTDEELLVNGIFLSARGKRELPDLRA
jgi:hypothetical protein